MYGGRGRRIIHWELVPDLSGLSGPEPGPLHQLDRMLPGEDPSVLRLLGDDKVPALLTAFTALLAISASSGQVKITGGPANDPEAEVLWLASPDAVHVIDSLFAFINTQNLAHLRPAWVGLPLSNNSVQKVSPHPMLGSQDGDLAIRNKKQTIASFALFPVRSNQGLTRLQPAQIKLSEPKGNLRERSEWFQRRSGKRKG